MPALAPISLPRSITLRAIDISVAVVGLLVLREWHRFRIDDVLLWYLIPALALTSAGVFHLLRVYDCLHRGDLRVWCSRVLLAWAVVLGLFFSAVYTFQLGTDLPRLVVVPWATLTGAALVLVRVGLYGVMLSRHRRGVSGHRILLAGEHAHCRRLARHLTGNPAFGMQIAGICTDRRLGDGRGDRYPVLGRIEDLPRAVAHHDTDRVLVATPVTDPATPRRVLELLAKQPVTVQYAPDLGRLGFLGFQAADYGGQAIFNLSASPLTSGGIVVKWIEDKLLALVILLCISPLLLLIAAAVKLTSRGPVFFVQERHGLYGRPIKVLKFRSMRLPDSRAEAEAAAKGCEATASGRFKQACDGDRRITAIGGFLRRTSLDELPQFFNVLKGDMSIVGPRPHPIGLNMQYADAVEGLMRRHYVKPGITGLAQVSGARGETRTVEDMRKRVHYDLEYIRTWSLWLDLRIIVRTIWKGFVNFQP